MPLETERISMDFSKFKGFNVSGNNSAIAQRPEAIDKGDFIIAGIDEKSLLQAVDTAVELCRDGQHGIPVPDYVDENVSTKVVKIVQSYVGIVNKMVWRKF